MPIVMALLCFALLFSEAGPVCAATLATLAKFSGEVSFRHKDNTAYQAVTGQINLEKGAWVKTGRNGWVELTLADKSVFTLANNSELELTDLTIGARQKDGLFTLNQGKLRAAVTTTPGLTSSFKIKNRSVVAGVKGTEFLMLSEGPANVFFGNEGRVAVSGHDGKEKNLGPQFMTQATRGYTPIEPVAVEPDSPVAEAKAAFEAATRPTPPDEWLASDNFPAIIARWNISYGHYLADAGKYDEALHVFQLALDLAKTEAIRCDARLERSAVYARFLNNPESALAENLLILEEYPAAPQAESALFNAGQILFELSSLSGARARLTEYRQKYPQGKHRNNVETLLRILNR